MLLNEDFNIFHAAFWKQWTKTEGCLLIHGLYGVLYNATKQMFTC
jgi:hypothetical protein